MKILQALNPVVPSGKTCPTDQVFAIGNFADSSKIMTGSPSVYRQALHESTDRYF